MAHWVMDNCALSTLRLGGWRPVFPIDNKSLADFGAEARARKLKSYFCKNLPGPPLVLMKISPLVPFRSIGWWEPFCWRRQDLWTEECTEEICTLSRALGDRYLMRRTSWLYGLHPSSHQQLRGHRCFE